jgi:hypothetical protein
VDWSNEEYVRVYTRETADDLDLSWEALAIWRALLLKFDRSGVISARNGWLSVSRMTRIPAEVVERAGPELLADGRLRQIEGGFLAPNFIDAQTASKSDRVRQKESRDRRRQEAAAQVVDPPSGFRNAQHDMSRDVTAGHAQSHARHDSSRNVTLCSALPPSADPLPPDASALLPVTPAAPAKPVDKFGDLSGKVDKAVREREKKQRLPDGWMPCRSEATLEAERVAASRGVDVPAQLQNLRDWARANNAKKADWDATWRNWTRNAKPSGPQRGRTPLELQLERVRMLEAEERAGHDQG